jgi:hypothetical protein
MQGQREFPAGEGFIAFISGSVCTVVISAVISGGARCRRRKGDGRRLHDPGAGRGCRSVAISPPFPECGGTARVAVRIRTKELSHDEITSVSTSVCKKIERSQEVYRTVNYSLCCAVIVIPTKLSLIRMERGREGKFFRREPAFKSRFLRFLLGLTKMHCQSLSRIESGTNTVSSHLPINNSRARNFAP